MRRYMLIAFLVVLAGCLYATRAEAAGFVFSDIFSDFTPTKAGCPPTCPTGPTGDGTPYSGKLGTINTPDVKFFTNFAGAWHPFGQSAFGADIKGPLNVSSLGTYTFGLKSDDGSRLFIDGVALIDNGGAHSDTTLTGSKLLTAGFHTFEVTFFECCGGPSGVDLNVPEGIALTPEPSTLLLMAPGMVGMAWYWRRKKIA